jgi:hypothetical protein
MTNSTERTDRYRYFPNHRLNVARERPFASVFYPFPNVGWTIMPHVRETPAPRCGWQLNMTLRRIGAKYLQATKHPVGKPFSLIRKNCAAAHSVLDRALRNNVLRSGRRAHRTIGKSDRTVGTVAFRIPPSLTSLLPISPQLLPLFPLYGIYYRLYRPTLFNLYNTAGCADGSGWIYYRPATVQTALLPSNQGQPVMCCVTIGIKLDGSVLSGR